MADYYAILTNTGKALEAEAVASGTKITLVKFVVGDGNGQAQIPDPARTTLVHEVYRNSISDLTISAEQPNQIVAKLVMPANIGGFTVREIGLLTDKGELYAIANCATFDKPANGISITMQFRLAVSETDNVTLNVATGEGLFLRQDANLSDVKDKEKARKNLQLGSAATKDVGVVVGNVMQVGAFGLGGAAPFSSSPASIEYSGFANYGGVGDPGLSSFGGLFSSYYGGSEKYSAQLYISGNSRECRLRFLKNGVADWSHKLFHEGNKPTAQDVGALSISGGTLTGQLIINNADFINKNGYTTYTDGDGNLHRQTGGLRLGISDTILTEIYYNETQGKSAELSLHNKYGSTDAYISLRNDGQLSVIGVSPQIVLSNGTIFATDGNVKGRVWDNDYLSNWILSKANAAKDAAIDWANTNCARKPTAWLQPTGWIRDATTGYITQWGIVTRGGGTTRVWFPNAFPNACVNVLLTLRNSNSGGSDSNVLANGEDTQGFNYISRDNEVQAFWEAKGY